MDPLSQLRDIHLPEPISWWPLAPGWWLLLILSVLLLLGLIAYLRRQQRLARPRRAALRQLDVCYQHFEQNGNNITYLRELNQLLKRVAVNRVDPAAKRLSGNSWLEFLDKSMGSSEFSSGAGQCLIEGPYSREAAVNGPALHQLCKQWVQQID